MDRQVHFLKALWVPLVLALVLGGGSLAKPLWAGLPESFGLNPQLIGQSGAGAGVHRSWTAAYHNPAAMAAPTPGQDTGLQDFLGMSLVGQEPSLKIKTGAKSTIAQNNARIGSDLPGYSILALGLTADMRRLMKVPVPVRAGVMLATPGADGTLVRLQETGQKTYNFQRAGRGPAKPSIATSLGFQVWPDRLSLGVGLHYSAQIDGNIHLTEIQSDPDAQPVTETRLHIQLKPALLVGAMYRQPLPAKTDLLVGLRYRQENSLDADLDVVADIPLNGLTIAQTIESEIVNYFQPHSFLFSTGLTHGPYRIFSDVEYQAWSRFHAGGTRALFEQAPNFNDIIIWRIGGGMRLPASLFGIDLRGGYGLIPAYTPNQNRAANYLDTDKHIISLGLGKHFAQVPRLDGSVQLNMAVQYQFWASRSTTKDLRTSLPDGSLQPDYAYGGGVLVGSLGATLHL